MATSQVLLEIAKHIAEKTVKKGKSTFSLKAGVNMKKDTFFKHL